jgi:hypothetical protein
MVGVGLDMAFEHDLGRGGHGERQAQRGSDLGACAAQQARELVFAQRVGHGRDGTQQRGRVGPQRHGHGVRLAGVCCAVVGKIERAAPVGQPAHDDLVAPDHLLAVDAQVLPRLAWSRA